MADMRVSVPLHRGAEAFSFWTHGVGVLAAIVGLVFLLLAAESTRETVAFLVYGLTLIGLLSASTAHHAVQTATGHERSGIMRRIDHVSIYLFIAGTYTPVTLLAFPTGWGWSIFGVVWGSGGKHSETGGAVCAAVAHGGGVRGHGLDCGGRHRAHA